MVIMATPSVSELRAGLETGFQRLKRPSRVSKARQPLYTFMLVAGIFGLRFHQRRRNG